METIHDFGDWINLPLSKGYSFNDVMDYSDYYENLKTDEQNFEDFKQWVSEGAESDAAIIFSNRFGDLYIPENAEDESEHYTFRMLRDLCEEEWESDKILKYNFPHPADLLHQLVSNIDWQFPETFIDEIKNND